MNYIFKFLGIIIVFVGLNCCNQQGLPPSKKVKEKSATLQEKKNTVKKDMELESTNLSSMEELNKILTSSIKSVQRDIQIQKSINDNQYQPGKDLYDEGKTKINMLQRIEEEREALMIDFNIFMREFNEISRLVDDLTESLLKKPENQKFKRRQTLNLLDSLESEIANKYVKKINEFNKEINGLSLRIEPFVKNNTLYIHRYNIFINNKKYQFFDDWNVKGHFKAGHFEIESLIGLDKTAIEFKAHEIKKSLMKFANDEAYKDIDVKIFLYVSGYSDTNHFVECLEKNRIISLYKERYGETSSYSEDELNKFLSLLRAESVRNYMKQYFCEEVLICSNLVDKVSGMCYELPSENIRVEAERRVAQINCYIIGVEKTTKN